MACIHIIEDDVDLMAVLKTYFTAQGYAVCDDYNGNRFEAGEDLAPDLFLIDINLRDKSGLDICSNLKKSKSPHPVILMSAVDNLSELAHRCRADGYIQKPFVLEDMKKKIEVHMQDVR